MSLGRFLVPFGIFLIFLGIFVVLFGSMKNSDSSGSRFAVGGFIGPVPFGFGNSPFLVYIIVGISAFFLIVFLILRYWA